MDLLFDTCWDYVQRGGNAGVRHRQQRRRRRLSAALGASSISRNCAEHMRAKLAHWGGNSSGVNIANIDNLGNVHPDTFWWHYTLGNVRERPFSEIWPDTSDPLMAGLKAHAAPVKGRCGACQYFDICGGNTRVRAMQLTGDSVGRGSGLLPGEQRDRRRRRATSRAPDTSVTYDVRRRYLRRQHANMTRFVQLILLTGSGAYDCSACIAAAATAQATIPTGAAAVSATLRHLPRRRPPRRHRARRCCRKTSNA